MVPADKFVLVILWLRLYRCMLVWKEQYPLKVGDKNYRTPWHAHKGNVHLEYALTPQRSQEVLTQ